MVNAIKISFGAFFIILGLFIINKFQEDTISVIGGIACIAVGLGIIASKN